MKNFDSRDNIYNAVDAFIQVVVISGTKTPAESYINRLKNCLSVYDDVTPIESFETLSICVNCQHTLVYLSKLKS